MHIPDGFLDTKTAVATAALSATAVGIALRHVRKSLPQRQIPLMGLTAAFVFAAQMVNFPVAAGTSGHLMGAVLAAALVGPSAGVLTMTSVLVVQALLFADGGLVALGANILNMAVGATLSGYGVMVVLRKALPGSRGQVVSAATASWCSMIFAALLCSGELAWSGTVSWGAAFPAMVNVHMVIGLGEAVITSLVIVGLGRLRPELLERKASSLWGSVMLGMVLVLALVLFVSPFASEWPDGLERVAGTLGFEQKALDGHSAVMSDYQIPGVGSAVAATALAGGIGVVVVFALSFLLARFLVPAAPARE